MELQQMRIELEKNYSHVTYVKEVKIINSVLWYVNDGMEKIYIPLDASEKKLQNIIAQFETDHVINEMSSNTVITRQISDKLSAFKNAIKSGAIKPDRKLYKKYTTKQFNDML